MYMIYTDGGARPTNPGPGGWGVVILYPDGRVHELGGSSDGVTTNNAMELTAAIQAVLYIIRCLTPSDRVQIHVDSTYVKNGITGWIKSWKKRDWKTSTGTPVMNRELWEELDSLVNSGVCPMIEWLWVRGHGNNVHNNRADEISTLFALRSPVTLRSAQDGDTRNTGLLRPV